MEKRIDYAEAGKSLLRSLYCWTCIFGISYLGYLSLSLIFWNSTVFFLLFGLCVAGGAWFSYGGKAWDNQTIVIKRITEVLDHGDR